MAKPWPPLLGGENELPDPDPNEGILRAIGIRSLDGGQIGLSAFELSSPEKVSGHEKLSTARETKQTATDLHAERNAVRPGSCVAVAIATVAAIRSCDSLRVIDDSALVRDATGHCYVDLRLVAKTERRLIYRLLAEVYNVGVLHQFA